MDAIAEVVSIEELRRRRAARDAARSAAASRPPAVAWLPVWIAWLPVWQPAPAIPAAPLRAAAWSGR
jgi:hypothetical protein